MTKAQLGIRPLCDALTGRSLHSQVEHHVRDKFATPILYGIDNFKFYDIFSTYTYPLITSFVYFFEIFSHIHFLE